MSKKQFEDLCTTHITHNATHLTNAELEFLNNLKWSLLYK